MVWRMVECRLFSPPASAAPAGGDEGGAMTPTFLSLFSGIGGLDLGLERAGWRCVGQVEIDPFCRRVLAKHWPHVPRFEDVRTVHASDFTEEITLIAGGFPCQDISNAGRRAGIDGERSGLWSEYFRIVCEVRPEFVCVENVSALLERGIGRVLGDLASIGYDAEWACIPACSFGAPHIRDRVFILAYPVCGGTQVLSAGQWGEGPGEIDFVGTRAAASLRHSRHAERGGLEGGILGCAEPPAKIAAAGRGTSLGTYLGEAWAAEPGESWLDDGISGEVAEFCSRGFGNAVVPQVAEWIGCRLMEAYRAKNPAEALSEALQPNIRIDITSTQPAGFEPATGGLEILPSLTPPQAKNADSSPKTGNCNPSATRDSMPNSDLICTPSAAPGATDALPPLPLPLPAGMGGIKP